MPASAATSWSQWMDRKTLGFTQMGGEGANWIGEAPFSKRKHVFQNLGDGTYNHSGYLAIRAAIASGVNITYKILFNDAVAMTGGQRNDGGLTVPQIARQVAAEGAKRIVVVTDEPGKYPSGTDWPTGITFHHRDELDDVQRELADDRRAHGADLRPDLRGREAPPPQARRSSPIRTSASSSTSSSAKAAAIAACNRTASRCSRSRPNSGRKRTIDQSSCNKDYSCVKGFCPSFVTVEGAKLKTRQAASTRRRTCRRCPSRTLPAIDQHLSASSSPASAAPASSPSARCSAWRRISKARASASSTWPASRRRAARCYSHIRIAKQAGGHPRHPRRRRASADLVLGGDIVVAGNKKVLAPAKPGGTTDGDQHRRNPAGRFHPQCRFLAADRAAEARDRRGGGRGATPFRRCDAARDRAARQFDRRQHVHARLRLSDRRAAALGARRSSRRSS